MNLWRTYEENDYFLTMQLMKKRRRKRKTGKVINHSKEKKIK